MSDTTYLIGNFLHTNRYAHIDLQLKIRVHAEAGTSFPRTYSLVRDSDKDVYYSFYFCFRFGSIGR